MPLAAQADIPKHLTEDNLAFDIKVYNQELLETLQ